MALVPNKRSVMLLYSGMLDIESHRVRIVLAEKGIAVDIANVDLNDKPEDFVDLNPYNTLPTLVDRDLVLYQSNIIMEYLDERFPHPPLLPVYPVARAKSRLMMYRIKLEWDALTTRVQAREAGAAKELEGYLTKLAPVFANAPYFMSEDFSLVDCFIAPVLWRLPSWGIKLPASAKAVEAYAKRVFARDAFIASLTESEQELREREAESLY